MSLQKKKKSPKHDAATAMSPFQMCIQDVVVAVLLY